MLEVSVNGKVSKWTCDSGAEANCMLEEECDRLGLEVFPTSQGATQGDGRTPLNIVGEVHFTALRGHHKLVFNGLVVKQLDTSVLAGMPFHKTNHIQINYSLSYILIEDCCKINFDPERRSYKKPNMRALRICRQTCILPGEEVTFQLPDDLRTNDSVALEPRTTTVPKDMPEWIQCGIYSPDAEGRISVKNTSTEPVLVSKHAQVCQVRKTVEINKGEVSIICANNTAQDQPSTRTSEKSTNSARTSAQTQKKDSERRLSCELRAITERR